MREKMREGREAAIHDAAYTLVAEKGYADTSMLAIAKQAKASNETLYRWYGDKKGLFQSMVEANARSVRSTIVKVMEQGRGDRSALDHVAPQLLAMLLSERAITLNRAAAADTSGELGAALAAGGRDGLHPLFQDLIARDVLKGKAGEPSAGQAVEWLFSLLVGDLQVRRVNRSMAEPAPAFIRARAASALKSFRRLVRDNP